MIMDIILPKSWNELTDRQLYYIYSLIADNLSVRQIKAYCFFCFGKISLVTRHDDGYEVRHGKRTFFISAVAVAQCLGRLDWVADFPESPVCISSVKGHKCFHPMFLGVPFEKFIYCDNIYQGFLSSRNNAALEELAQVLYDTEDVRFGKTEKISVFYWFAAVKAMLARRFPNFFMHAPKSAEDTMAMTDDVARRVSDAMNAQIRALTKGDITKEKQVLATDTWRALTELDAIAREARELRTKYPEKNG